MRNETIPVTIQMFTPGQQKMFLQSGSNEDFLVLYTIYAAPLFAIILRMVKCRIKAEYILENTFIKARKEADSFDNCSFSMFIWLMRIAVQLCLPEKKPSGKKILKEDILTACSSVIKNKIAVHQ